MNDSLVIINLYQPVFSQRMEFIMKLLLLTAAVALSIQGHAAPLNEGSLNTAPLTVSNKSDVLEFKIDDQLEQAKETSLKTSNKSLLAQRSFTNPNISGYACNISHTPSETNKWSIILYNLSDPQDEGEVVFSVSKNRKIQSVACLPNGEQLIFSIQESAQGDTEIYSMDLLTNSVNRLTDNDTDDNDVSISQDGTVMAWQKRLPDGRQAITIRTYGATGSAFTEKSLASANPFVQPSLSSNGEWLALVQLRTNNFLALRYDVSNNLFKTIHSIPRRKRLFHPSVSADGNLYSWVENKAQSKFLVKDINKNTITKLITGVAGIEHPYLSQTGESVMYSIGEQTLIKNISTGATEEINFATRFLGSYWMGAPEPPKLIGSWELPGKKVIFHFLPDGRYFAKQFEEENNIEGFEYGTYEVSNGEITFTTQENHDGDALTCWADRGVACDGENGTSQEGWAYSLVDNELSLSPPDEDFVVTLDRIEATDSLLDGLWESLEDKEIIFFMGGDTYFYVDYLNDDPQGDIVFDLGKYTITSEDGDSVEARLDTSHTYNYATNGPVCEQVGNVPCESATYSFSKVNGQLVLIDPDSEGSGSRAYFNQLLIDDGSPADTAKLVAQKDYASDIAANQDYGVEINSNYRIRMRSNTATDLEQASSVSSKFNIDDTSTLVRDSSGGSASLRTRLSVYYAYPGNENRDAGLTLKVSVRLRSFGGAASAKYVVDTCFDSNCDNEVYIERIASNLGTFTGDHEMAVRWDNNAQAFVFIVDGSEVGRITMAEYNSEASAYSSFDAAAGNYTFSPSDYDGTEVRVEVADVGEGESGYIALHLDEVKVGDEAYDDFSNGLIDFRKWWYESAER